MSLVLVTLALWATSSQAPSEAGVSPSQTTTTAATANATTTAHKPSTGAKAAAAAAFLPITDKDYERIVLAPRRGKVVLVNFWASYCQPCLEEIPALLALRRQLADDVDIVFVSTDDPAALPRAQQALTRSNLTLGPSYFVAHDDPTPFLTVVDPAWGGAVPHTIIYGRDGAIWQTLVGGQADSTFSTTLHAAVAAAPRPAQTPLAPIAPKTPLAPATPRSAQTP